MSAVVGEIDHLAAICHLIAKEHGFWDSPFDPDHPLTIPAKLALVHSEASEALKADRDLHTDWERQHDILEELADTVIRCLDLAHYVANRGKYESFGRIIMDKVKTNHERPNLHGKRY